MRNSMKKTICTFLVAIAPLCCFTSCVQVTVYQNETTSVVESKEKPSSNTTSSEATKVSFEELIRSPEKYKDKLIQISCFVSSTKEYTSFQSVRISTKENITGDYENDSLILRENNFYSWNVIPVDTWQNMQYDTRLQIGDNITIVGYFRFRQRGENAEWYDGIESEGDYGKIFATEITFNDFEA